MKNNNEVITEKENEMTKEEHYQQYIDVSSKTFYKLTGFDIIEIIKEKGFNLTNEKYEEIIDYFSHKFEMPNWDEYVRLTLGTYFEENPENDIDGKKIEF